MILNNYGLNFTYFRKKSFANKSLPKYKNMKVINVKHLADYKLEVMFSTNETKIINLENFLKNAKNPMISENLKLENFKNVAINTGFLSWNNGTMELSAESLYEIF